MSINVQNLTNTSETDRNQAVFFRGKRHGLRRLRGRDGRGGSQSYCILMSGVKLSTDTRKRLRTMVETNNGFEIAQVDLELRGPGDVTGTQQSGIIDLKVANLAKDGRILTVAREEVIELLDQDPDLEAPDNQPVKRQVENFSDSDTYWSKIS